MMETQLEDLELAEGHFAALSADLGDIQTKMDGIQQAMVEKLMPVFKEMRTRLAEAVQQLERQRRGAKTELESAQKNFLAEREVLLKDSKDARQRFAEERRQLLEEKEKLQRMLAEANEKREDDRQSHAEKLLSLERKQQEERQRLTAAWEAEKEANALLAKKLKKAKHETHSVRRDNAALLQGGVRSSALGSARKGPSAGEVRLPTPMEAFQDSLAWKASDCRAPQETNAQVPGVTLPEPDSRNQASANQGLALNASQVRTPLQQQVPERSPPPHVLTDAQPDMRVDRTGGPECKDAGFLRAAALLPGGAEPGRSGSSQRKRPIDDGDGSDRGVGPATRRGTEPCGEKRSLEGLAGDLIPEDGVSGGKSEGASSSDRKRRKQIAARVLDGASQVAPLAPGEDDPIGTVSSMETVLLTRTSQGVSDCGQRGAGCVAERAPVEEAGAQNGRVEFPAVASLENGSTAASTRPSPEGNAEIRAAVIAAVSKHSRSEGLRKSETSSGEGGVTAKRDRSQLVSTLNRQRRAVSAGNRGAGWEEAGLDSTALVSAAPLVLGARDQNGVNGSRKAVSSGASPRAGSEGLPRGYERLFAEGHAVSDGPVRGAASDADSDGEVCSPKRRRRARSAGAARPSGVGKKARNLAESFEQSGGMGEAGNVPPLGGDEEEGFELGGRESRGAAGAAGNDSKTAGLPQGEKGKWMSVREGKTDPGVRKEGPQRLVQTRLSQPTRKEAPSFKSPTYIPGQGGGRKWREASRAVEDDFLSTPMEKAHAGRGSSTEKHGQKSVQSGRNGLARDLGTGVGDQRGEGKTRRDENTLRLAEDSDIESDNEGEKENSQPDDGLEPPGVANQVCLDGAEPVNAVGREVPGQGDGPGPSGHRNRGIQVIRPGTYAHTAAERGRQLASGDVPAHKYNAVIRKKDEREGLHAMDCANCRKFYEAVVDNDGDAMERNVHNVCSHQHHLDVASRHRYQYEPPATPSGFWNIGFDTETQAAS